MRDARWDFYKGLLMLSVVLGHVITALMAGSSDPVWVAVFIRTFDMPMFAFVTGVFLQKSCNKRFFTENVLNKVGMILLPIILWNWILNIASGNLSLEIGRLWFLWSIFFVCCIVILIDAMAQKKEGLKVILFGCVVLVFHTIIIDPWNIGFLLFPCVMGYYYNTIETKLRKHIPNMKVLQIGIVIIFFVCQLFWKVDYNVWNAGCNILDLNVLPKILFRGGTGIVGCLAMKTIFDFIYDKLPKSSILIRAGVKLGAVTMEMYILQTLLVEHYGASAIVHIVNAIGFNPFIISINILGFIIAPIVAIISLVIMYWIIVFIKRIPKVGKYIYGISYTEVKSFFGKKQSIRK